MSNQIRLNEQYYWKSVVMENKQKRNKQLFAIIEHAIDKTEMDDVLREDMKEFLNKIKEEML